MTRERMLHRSYLFRLADLVKLDVIAREQGLASRSAAVRWLIAQYVTRAERLGLVGSGAIPEDWQGNIASPDGER